MFTFEFGKSVWQRCAKILRSKRLWIVVGLILFGIGLLPNSFLHSTGDCWGVEWSPDLFLHRSFHYYQVFGVRVTSRNDQEWRSALEEHLHEKGYIPDPPIANVRWRLVKRFEPGSGFVSGNAKTLCHAFGCYGDSKNMKWREWSLEHPNLAAILWPKVVSFAQVEEYDLVAELFLAIKTNEQQLTPVFLKRLIEDIAENNRKRSVR